MSWVLTLEGWRTEWTLPWIQSSANAFFFFFFTNWFLVIDASMCVHFTDHFLGTEYNANPRSSARLSCGNVAVHHCLHFRSLSNVTFHNMNVFSPCKTNHMHAASTEDWLNDQNIQITHSVLQILKALTNKAVIVIEPKQCCQEPTKKKILPASK